MKEIFKVGDEVFDISAGWGTVYSVTDTDIVNYNVVVQFDMATYYYTSNGVNVEGYKKLSFTEYTFKGFSQERPIEEKIVVTTEYNAFEDKFYGLVVIQGRQGSHPLYDVVYNGGCRDEYFDTELDAKQRAKIEARKIILN